MELHYELYTDLLPETRLTSLLDLLTAVFVNQPQSEIRAEFDYQRSRTGLEIFLALDNEQVIGCKLGYERKPDQYYSWLGGVHSDFRGRGIAAELMRQQHNWCRQHGYHKIRTETYNQWRSMLILNLRHDFNIVGTVQGKHGLTIVLEKIL